MDTPLPVLPPGCSLRGRTLHLDLDLGVGAVVLALDAARYCGLSVIRGRRPADLAR